MASGPSSGRGVKSRSPSESLSEHEETSPSTPASSHIADGQLRDGVKLPLEVLVQILNLVSFSDLFGSTQYVDRTWHYVSTHLILGNAVFMRCIIQTDYRLLLTTISGCQEDEPPDPENDPSDDTWQGVALDTRFDSEFDGLADARWRAGNGGKKFFFMIKGVHNHPNVPFILRGRLYTYLEQMSASDQEYYCLKKLSIDQRRPVLLDVVDFDDRSGEILLDLRECYKVIYDEYKTVLSQKATLLDFLQADFWTPWCRKHGKYWGKKKMGLYREGAFIDHVEQCNQALEGTFGDLEPVLKRWDLLHRKMSVYEQMTMHNLAASSSSPSTGLNFEDSYRSRPATWADSSPSRTVRRIDDDTRSVCVHHRARYDATIDLMSRTFTWAQAGQMAADILTEDEYAERLRDWKTRTMHKWAGTRVVHETRFYIVEE